MFKSIGFVNETNEIEARVAIEPTVADKFIKKGITINMQKSAGSKAFFCDESYGKVGVKTFDSTKEVIENSDIIVRITPPDENFIQLISNKVLIAPMYAHQAPEVIEKIKSNQITVFALELIPRITRAQSMDILSSQATAAGYKAVLMAANLVKNFFPMLTTAAGTIRPARVVVIGAGVAGLQAIATAKRLGAIVEAYDIRPAAREQVESLGAKMIDTGVNAEGEGGYARDLTEEEKQQQADKLAKHIAKANVVISTASIPGRPAPKIITKMMVENMLPGSAIIDLSAPSGGNCELTQVGKTIIHNDVNIAGPLDLISSLSINTSQMFAKNIYNYLELHIKESGQIEFDYDDEVIDKSMLSFEGTIKKEIK